VPELGVIASLSLRRGRIDQRKAAWSREIAEPSDKQATARARTAKIEFRVRGYALFALRKSGRSLDRAPYNSA
jgi:hypothetical protein